RRAPGPVRRPAGSELGAPALRGGGLLRLGGRVRPQLPQVTEVHDMDPDHGQDPSVRLAGLAEKITDTARRSRRSEAVWRVVNFAAVMIVAITAVMVGRSEEHTSELQSRENLVCRLLLEKKKKNTTYN